MFTVCVGLEAQWLCHVALLRAKRWPLSRLCLLSGVTGSNFSVDRLAPLGLCIQRMLTLAAGCTAE